MDVTFLLNGESVSLYGVDPTQTVLDWLRNTQYLTGTKEGCNEGDCGACTVTLGDTNGTRAVNACILFMGQLQNKALTTIEALSDSEQLHSVQQAMIDNHGSQCGFCTPGIVMSLAAAHENGDTNHDDVLAGNLCRCTGYAPIIRAAKEAEAAPKTKKFVIPAPAQPNKNAEKVYPTTVEALTQALADNPDATLVSGATDVGLWATKSLKDLTPVIFLSGIEALKTVDISNDTLEFGAGVTIETLREEIAPYYPHFAQMLRRFASKQVRNAATLGGNIANGSPIGDAPPALIALDARLTLTRQNLDREIPLEDFFIAYGKQDRASDEIVRKISIPRTQDRLKVYKLSKRFDQDISAVLGAFNITVEDNKVTAARIAFGGMAATPKRAISVENALIDQPWNEETVRAAMGEFANDFAPLSDMRASSGYRLKTAQNMLRRYFFEDQNIETNVLEVTP